MDTGPCSGDSSVVDDTLNGQMGHRNAISFEINVDSDGISSVAASAATLVAFHGRATPARIWQQAKENLAMAFRTRAALEISKV